MLRYYKLFVDNIYCHQMILGEMLHGDDLQILTG